MGRSDAQSFLEDMVRRHGHVSDLHRVLAEHDLDFLRSYEELLDTAYRRPRRLTKLVKEFSFIAMLASLGASTELLRSHMLAAATEGATSVDILEVLELVLPAAGVARFQDAVEVWREVFGI